MIKEDKLDQSWGYFGQEIPNKYYKGLGIEITKENRSFYFLVVIWLGLITFSTVVGVFILACHEKIIPNALVAIGSVAVGALSGLFSKNT